MTVIAWDGRTLAADKRMSLGCHIVTVRKIFRVGDQLVAVSGSAKHTGAVLRWLTEGAKPETFPIMAKEETLHTIVIQPNGNVLRYEDGPYPIRIEDQQFANGSGRDYARAAMHCGKTAREAVEIACLFDENCGNGIDTLTLDASEAPRIRIDDWQEIDLSSVVWETKR